MAEARAGTRRGPGFQRLLLLQLAVILVSAGADELDSEALVRSVQGGEQYEDLGVSMRKDARGANLLPPQEIPKTPSGGKRPADRRVVDSVSERLASDPRRSQLRPDCKPFLENTRALIAQGKSCKELCERNKCVSYQEFPSGDKYYPEGECKLFACPSRFISTDTRRSEVIPNCNAFSENNGDFMAKTGRSCSGMCARAKGCRAYVEWNKGSDMYPKGECKLYKCSPKYELVDRAEREATRLKQEAKVQIQATEEAAERQRNEDEMKGKEIVKKGKDSASEVRTKAQTVERDVKEKKKEANDKALAKAKKTAIEAGRKADATKEVAEKTANTVVAKAQAEEAKVKQDATEKAEKATATHQAAEEFKSRLEKEATELKEKAEQQKYNATETAAQTKSIATAEAKEKARVADELVQKSKAKAAAEKTTKEKSKKEEEKKVADIVATANNKAAEVGQKAQDAAQLTRTYAKDNATVITQNATDATEALRAEAKALELKIKKETQTEKSWKEDQNKKHAAQLEKDASAEKAKKATMLQQLLVKQNASEVLIKGEKKKAEAAVAQDELKNKKQHTEVKEEAKTLEAQAKKDALGISMKANQGKKEVDAKAAKITADAKAAAADEKDEKAKLNAARLKTLENEAKSMRQEAASTESSLKSQKKKLEEDRARLNQETERKTAEIAEKSSQLQEKLSAGQKQAEEAEQKALSANDRSATEAAADALAKWQSAVAETEAAQLTGHLKLQHAKELLTKASKAQRAKQLIVKEKRQKAEATDAKVAQCQDDINSGEERRVKARAILANLTPKETRLQQAKSDEQSAKASEGIAKGHECLEKAREKQQVSTVAMEGAENAASLATKTENKRQIEHDVLFNNFKKLEAAAASTQAKAAESQKTSAEVESKEAANKANALHTLKKERDQKASQSAKFAKTILKESADAEAKAEAAKTAEAVEAEQEAANMKQDVEKLCLAAQNACAKSQAAKTLAAQAPNDDEKKSKAADLAAECVRQTGDCDLAEKKENTEKKAADQKRSELATKTEISKKLAKTAEEQAERATAADKARELTEKTDETKIKAGEAAQLRKKAEEATVEPNKKLSETKKKQVEAQQVARKAEAATAAVNNQLKALTEQAEVAANNRDSAKEVMQKAEVNFESESAPFKEAEKAQKEAENRVAAAAAKVDALVPNNKSTAELGESGLSDDLEVMTLLDLDLAQNASGHKGKPAAMALSAAISRQENLAAQAKVAEMQKSKIDKLVQQAEAQKNAAIAKAKDADTAKNHADAAYHRALSESKASKEKATKSQATYAALDTRVQELTQQTEDVESSVKSLAQEDMNAQHAAEAAAEKQSTAAQKASEQQTSAQDADEAAAKAMEVKNRAKAQLVQAQARLHHEQAAFETAAQNAKSALNEAKKTSELKGTLLGKLGSLQKLHEEDVQAQAAAKQTLDVANSAAAKAGDTALINFRTILTGVNKTDFDQGAITAFAKSVASTLGVQMSQVNIKSVKGGHKLTVEYVVHQNDVNSAVSMKDVMESIHAQDFMDTFQKHAARLGESLPTETKIDSTAGSVSENLTQQQKLANAAYDVARHNLTMVTKKVASVSEASRMATQKAAEAATLGKQATQNKLVKREYLYAAQDKVRADQTAYATAKKSETSELGKRQKKDSLAQVAQKESAHAAGLAESLHQDQEQAQEKLNLVQDKEEAIGKQLDIGAEKRATANVHANRDAAFATEAAQDVERLLAAKNVADAAATVAQNEKSDAVSAAHKLILEQSALSHQLVVLATKSEAAKDAVMKAAKAHKKARDTAAKEHKLHQAAKEAAQAASEARAAQISHGFQRKRIFQIEVRSKLEGLTPAEFTEDVKEAYRASVAASLRVNPEDVVISESRGAPELKMQRLGDSSESESVDVKYVVNTPSRAAGESAKAAAKAIKPSELTHTFLAEAAAIGASVPDSVKADKLLLGETDIENTNTHVADVDAATEVLSAEKARLELAEVDVKRFKERYEDSKERLETSQEDFKQKEEKVVELEDQRNKKAQELKVVQEEQTKAGNALAEANNNVKIAAQAAEQADKFFKQLDVKAQLAAGRASAAWSEFLKGDADKKTAEANVKGEVELDVWTEALAKAAQQEGPCQDTAAKFKTIIWQARNDTLAKAEESCMADGKKWADFEERVGLKTAECEARHDSAKAAHAAEKAKLLDRATKAEEDASAMREKHEGKVAEVSELKFKNSQLQDSTKVQKKRNRWKKGKRQQPSLLDRVQELSDF